MAEQGARGGRPRSEQARVAVLQAVDGLFEEVGYAGLTMKGIAERAGVGRQTVYRWWSTKAEVLFEAALMDADKAFRTSDPQPTTAEDVEAFLRSVAAYLTGTDAGLAYRSLIGEAQHDPAVAGLLRTAAPFDAPATEVLDRAIERGDVPSDAPAHLAAAVLIGPMLLRVLTGVWHEDEIPALVSSAVAALGRIGAPGASGRRAEDDEP